MAWPGRVEGKTRKPPAQTHVHDISFDGLDLVGESAEVGVSKAHLGEKKRRRGGQNGGMLKTAPAAFHHATKYVEAKDLPEHNVVKLLDYATRLDGRSALSSSPSSSSQQKTGSEVTQKARVLQVDQKCIPEIGSPARRLRKLEYGRCPFAPIVTTQR